MMGLQAEPEQLFYDFCLEDHVPNDHLLRKINQFLDLDDLREKLKPFYSAMGRPSIDPALLVRMLIVGYCFGIRSERRLCEEVHLNLAYRWFCRLGLDGNVPDHSTFSLNRHGRFRDSDLLRHLFESTVERCLSEGLIGGDSFAVDASLIQADANKQRSLPIDEWNIDKLPPDAGRSTREYLETLNDAAFGAASDKQPKFISPADPASQWTGALRGPAFFAYATNYLIDTDNAVILDVEGTRAIRQAEVGSLRTMIERVDDCFGLKPSKLIGDSAYGAANNLGWLVNEKKALNRMFPYLNSPTGPMAHSLDPTFIITPLKIVISVQAARFYSNTGKPAERLKPNHQRMDCYDIEPANLIVTSAHLNKSAVLKNRTAKSSAPFMKMREMLPEIFSKQRNMKHPAETEKRWRCCLLISNAFLN